MNTAKEVKNQVIILSVFVPIHLFGKIKKYIIAGKAIKLNVPMSKKNPVRKVAKIVMTFNEISSYSQM
jgi:hypothetical protein